MSTNTQNTSSIDGSLLISIISVITVGLSTYLIYNNFYGWSPYITFNKGESFFCLWLNVMLWTVLIYNVFRVYDYTYTTPKSIQERHKKLLFKLLLGIAILFSPFLLYYLYNVFINFWHIQGYSDESSGNLFIRLLKAIFGFILLFVKYIYQFIKGVVTDSMIEVGFLGNEVYNINGKDYSVRDLPFIYDIASAFIIYMLIQYRKVILGISNFLYNLGNYVKRLIFGSNDEIMQKGFIRIATKRMKWFKGLVFFLLGIEVKKDTSRGSAEFADKSEEKEFLSEKQNGLLIDGVRCISWDLSMRHLAIIAPSGQGKTSNYVIPNILSLPEFLNPKSGTSASTVITDPKGEIFEATAQYLSEQGYKIKVIRVDEPLQSELFNPIKRANSDKDISKLAEIMVDSATSGGGGNGQDFWNNSAKMLLANVIRIIKRSIVPLEYQNLHNVKQFIDLMGNDGKPLAAFVKDHCNDHQAMTEYNSFTQQNDRTLSSILMTVKTILKDLGVREIAQLTSKDTINFESLRAEQTALFVITPFSDIEYYRFFLTNLYSQLFAFCDKNSKGNDIVFMMDEFGNLGKIPSFPQLITTLRSKRCSMSIILQDIEQLRMVYEKSGASAIINGGCSSKIFFGGISNMETLEEVSKMLGNQTLQQKTREGKELAPIARALMSPDEISRMQIGSGIFMSAISKPTKIEMTEYKESHLKDRVKVDDFGDAIVPETPNRRDYELPVLYFDFDSYIKEDED